LLKGFKEFAMRGNVADLAVGVIIGGAFGKIVTSLVNDLLMPVLGILTGGINFTELKWVLVPAQGEAAEVALRYGAFFQSVVDFLIVAFSIFLLIKAIEKFRKKETAAPPAPPPPSREEALLSEIRDILRETKDRT